MRHYACQARSNDCRFDVTSFSWLPQACYDDGPVVDFLALEAWQWFSTPSGTEPVSLEAVQKKDTPRMYVSWKYHVAH